MTYELEHKIQELTARIAELEEWANRATLTLNRILGIPLEQAPHHGGRPLPSTGGNVQYREDANRDAMVDAMDRAFNGRAEDWEHRNCDGCPGCGGPDCIQRNPK